MFEDWWDVWICFVCCSFSDWINFRAITLLFLLLLILCVCKLEHGWIYRNSAHHYQEKKEGRKFSKVWLCLVFKATGMDSIRIKMHYNRFEPGQKWEEKQCEVFMCTTYAVGSQHSILVSKIRKKVFKKLFARLAGKLHLGDVAFEFVKSSLPEHFV